MTDLFWNTITEDMRFVMSGFTQCDLGDRFYLAGGTALSLQIGHRRSVDLDFFSPSEDIPDIRSQLEKALASFGTTRKDFYDLYFICQSIPLRQIFDKAPKKYPSVRDFEAQAVKRLVYFENAEVEANPSMLQYVDWQTVKEYFIQQARIIEQSWLK